MSTIDHRTVYYLPGYGGQLATGLGQGLTDRGFKVTGRETRRDFRTLPFVEQAHTIRRDLQDHFWHERVMSVCNLLEPVYSWMRRPRWTHSWAGQFKAPAHCEVHVG